MGAGTILYVGGFELPDRNAAAQRVLGNAKALRTLGYETVLVGVDREARGGGGLPAPRPPVQGFESYAVPYPSSKPEWFRYLTDVSGALALLDSRPDTKAVIAYNYPAVALFRLRAACRRRGVRLFADCTEWYETKGNGLVFRILKGADSFLRMRIVQRRLDGLIVISRYLERFYRRCGNVALVPPLVDMDEPKWSVEPAPPRGNAVRFVYAGSPGKRKDNLERFLAALHAARHAGDFEFLVAGITAGEHLANHPAQRALIAELGERVRFLGRIPHADSIALLRSADYSVLVRDSTRTTRAGFPTKFVESVASGARVLATNSSDLREYLADPRLGVLVEDGEGTLEATLSRLIGEGPAPGGRDAAARGVFDYRNYARAIGAVVRRG